MYFFRRSTTLLLFAWIVFITGCSQILWQKSVSVTVKVHTAEAIDREQSIYITGNLRQIGNWDADGLRLTRISDNDWMTRFRVKKGTSIEYKFTKGSWAHEAMLKDCIVPGNSSLIAQRDTTIVTDILLWKDNCADMGGGITGNVRYHRDFSSKYLSTPRDIIVWLPPEFTEDEHYPVLYMHDGQNIIDPLTSYIGQDWKVDEVATQLISENRMKKIIIVGIYCTDLRTEEYSPMHLGDEYTRFIIEELKPFIDEYYPTLTDAENTAVMGSSMGGIISFHIAWEHPDVFSKAGCLSPAFLVDDEEIVNRVRIYSGPNKPVRFYIDNGTVGLDSELAPAFDKMTQILREKGYSNDDLMVFVDEGAVHNEIAWSNRIFRPLLFFFGSDLSGL